MAGSQNQTLNHRPHYIRQHFVSARQADGREMKEQHLDGKPFTVHL